jgi:hypothetical protein
MRDPERIDKVLEVIRIIWKANPDLRLTQLVLNIRASVNVVDNTWEGIPITTVEHEDLYNLEDEAFSSSLGKVVQQRLTAFPFSFIMGT